MLEKALINNYRYPTTVGNVTTEDLFGLPLTSKTGKPNLDDTAKSINKLLKDTEEESFVTPSSNGDSALQNKLEIVKHVIDLKIQARDAAKASIERKAQKDKIMAIIATKQDQALQEKDVSELEAMLSALN